MHKGYRTRRTYAQNHRATTGRSTATIYLTEAGEGILNQTRDGIAAGFTAPIVERVDSKTSVSVYFVQSEAFPTRYYGVCQRRDGSWHFSGDSKLADRYIGKVKAFQAQQLAVVA